tara:strand:+ start:75393 stop:75728 length:336 start_codon:yes stop_codon:yes gene_type:complete
MKKLRVMFAAIGLLIGTSVSTAAVSVEKEPTTTSEEITQFLENPEFIVSEEMIASVAFVVNKENEIVVLSVETENELLEGYIKNRLNYQKLQTNVKQGMPYTVPVRIVSLP